MATKWRSSFIIIFTAFLFTFGLSGILSFFIYGSDYMHSDYFHTSEFQTELEEFKGYLSAFELYNMPIEEAKKELKVTKDDITEHRYRYGNQTDQISNLKGQYEERIQEAMNAGNQGAADAYTAERDAKIADITKNFESDEYVEPKVLKEKEKRLEDYYKKRENYRSDYLRYKESFRYYVRNIETGKVYTNLKNTDEGTIKKDFSGNNTLFVTNTTVTNDDATFAIPLDGESVDSFIPTAAGVFEGQIAVPTSSTSTSFIMRGYENYRQNQMLLLIYSVTGLIAFIGSLLILRRTKASIAAVEKWQPVYYKIPIDVRSIFFIITLIGAFTANIVVSSQIVYVYHSPYDRMELIIGLIATSFIVPPLFIQWRYIKTELKDWSNVKKTMGKGVIH